MKSTGFIFVAVLAAGPASAQDTSQGTQGRAATTTGAQATQSAEASSSFDVAGGFDLGFRWQDVNGSRTKYREDINLQDGPRLFNLDLDVTPGQAVRFFDRLTLTANGLGGDPYEVFGVGLQKFGKYKFEYRRRSSEYFYRDLLSRPDQWSVPLSNGGDFHTFDFRRTDDTFDFSADLARGLTTFVKFDRFTREGESTTTIDIARDEFEFDAPLDQEKYDATVGVQYAANRYTLSFDETYRDWHTGGRIFLPGASPGENTTNAAELFFFERIAPFSFNMWQSTGKADVRPSDRLGITAAVSYATLDGDLPFQETTRGINFNAAPLNTFTEGRSGMDRTTTLFDLDVEYEVSRYLSLLGGVRTSRFDQSANLPETGQPFTVTDLEIASDVAELSARAYAGPRLAITGGVRFESRDTDIRVDEQESPVADTDRTTTFVTVAYQPVSSLSLLAEYERGDYDNPFTLISPTTLDRVKARIRYRPVTGLSLVGTLMTRRLDNSVSNASIDLTDFTAAVGYERQGAEMSASYSHRQVENDVTNEINVSPFLFPAIYESTLDMGTLDFAYRIGPLLRPGVGFVVYNNDGTFPLEWRQYQAFLEVAPRRGYLVRVAYRYNDFQEQAFAFEGYTANIVTLSVGYKF